MRNALHILVAVWLLAPLHAEPQPRSKAPFPRKAAMPAAAQFPALEKFREMSPEDRTKALQSLPPQRRQVMERRLAEWDRLSPQQRERLQGSYSDFQQLTPQRQQEVRQIFRRFSETFPPERRPLAQRMVRRLRAMEEDDRKRVMSSRRFQEEFAEPERRVIEDMVTKLP